MFGFSSGISALRASQLAITTISNNIANANTPGYHRQRVELGNRDPILQGGHYIGTGVDTLLIRQTIDTVIESSINGNASALSRTRSTLDAFRQIESIFQNGQGSVFNQLERFFGELQELSTEPDDPNRRLIILRNLGQLTSEVSSLSTGLDILNANSRVDIARDVEIVNQQFEELHQLNIQIKIARANGVEPNDLIDRIRQRSSEVSEIVDFEIINDSDGGFAFQFANGRFRFDDAPIELEAVENKAGEIYFGIKGSTIRAEFAAGRLAAQQKLVNDEIPALQQSLETFTNQFVFEFDRVQSTGLGLNNGFTSLVGAREIVNTSEALIDATAFKSVTAGSLFLSVTDESTGERTVHELAFDPQTQSIDDFATLISSVGNVNAVVQSQTGSVAIAAADGFRFDFAGRLETSIGWSDPLTTASTSLGGHYTGASNDNLNFQITGTGSVGATDGLELQVTSANGDPIGTYNIGTGYEPGSTIQLANGIEIQIGPGNVQDGSVSTSWAIAQSDETGVLAALGINSLFEGSNAFDVRVNQSLLDNPDLLATSLNGEQGDNRNVERMLALRSLGIGERSVSFESYVEQISITVAQEVNTLTFEESSLSIFSQQLLGQRDAISGVDPNEEMVDLLKYQRSYEASVRVISTIDQTLSDLFSIIR